MFNLDTIKLFYDDCRLLVTFENSLDQDQVTEGPALTQTSLHISIIYCFICAYSGPPLGRTSDGRLPNSEDPDEMRHCGNKGP